MSKKRKEPIEITKEKAFIAYVLCGSYQKTAQMVQVAKSTVKGWVEEGDWDQSRQDYFDEVHVATSAILKQELASRQAEIAAKALDWLDEMMQFDLPSAEAGSKADLWKAFETGVNAVEKLLVMSSLKEQRQDFQPTIQLSGEGQQIYLQSIKQLGIINEKDTEDLSEYPRFDFAGEREEYSSARDKAALPPVYQGESEE